MLKRLGIRKSLVEAAEAAEHQEFDSLEKESDFVRLELDLKDVPRSKAQLARLIWKKVRDSSINDPQTLRRVLVLFDIILQVVEKSHGRGDIVDNLREIFRQEFPRIAQFIKSGTKKEVFFKR
ncbi:MAG: hypothetical protein QW228_03140 [Candidatus Aenigmatarchaeota archaeon]